MNLSQSWEEKCNIFFKKLWRGSWKSNLILKLNNLQEITRWVTTGDRSALSENLKWLIRFCKPGTRNPSQIPLYWIILIYFKTHHSQLNCTFQLSSWFQGEISEPNDPEGHLSIKKTTSAKQLFTSHPRISYLSLCVDPLHMTYMKSWRHFRNSMIIALGIGGAVVVGLWR